MCRTALLDVVTVSFTSNGGASIGNDALSVRVTKPTLCDVMDQPVVLFAREHTYLSDAFVVPSPITKTDCPGFTLSLLCRFDLVLIQVPGHDESTSHRTIRQVVCW